MLRLRMNTYHQHASHIHATRGGGGGCAHWYTHAARQMYWGLWLLHGIERITGICDFKTSLWHNSPGLLQSHLHDSIGTWIHLVWVTNLKWLFDEQIENRYRVLNSITTGVLILHTRKLFQHYTCKSVFQSLLWLIRKLSWTSRPLHQANSSDCPDDKAEWPLVWWPWSRVNGRISLYISWSLHQRSLSLVTGAVARVSLMKWACEVHCISRGRYTSGHPALSPEQSLELAWWSGRVKSTVYLVVVTPAVTQPCHRGSR